MPKNFLEDILLGQAVLKAVAKWWQTSLEGECAWLYFTSRYRMGFPFFTHFSKTLTHTNVS